MAYPVTVEWREDREPVVSVSSAELSRLLDGIASAADPDHPLIAFITNEGGTLAIGLGAHVGSLNHVPPSNDPPYMICVGDPNAEGTIDFYLHGHHTQFPIRNTVTNTLARKAALEYAESGKLPGFLDWEET